MNGCSNEFEFDAWTAMIRGGPWNQELFGNYDYHGYPSSHEFCWLADDGASTVASPPPGKDAGSPTSQTCIMEDYNDNQKHLCSDSRAKTIARHRQEMLNMVIDMPDSIFELSMRDLVELPKIVNSIQETPGKGKEDKFLSGGKQKKAKKDTKRGSRRESMENGAFLLKVFPLFLGGRRKSSVTSSSSLPKPMLTYGEKGMLEKNTDGKCWKDNELGYLSEENGTNSRRR